MILNPNIVFGIVREKNKAGAVVRKRIFAEDVYGIVDKRVQRTRDGLVRGLIELMMERGYEGLTVQHILDRAGVGRATFYEHYRSKEDLLRQSLGILKRQLADACKSDARDLTLAFFRHVDGHRLLYRAIVGRESGVIVDRQMRRLLADLFREQIAKANPRTAKAVRTEMEVQYLVGALMSVMIWWLDKNATLTAEEVNRAFREMRPVV